MAVSIKTNFSLKLKDAENENENVINFNNNYNSKVKSLIDMESEINVKKFSAESVYVINRVSNPKRTLDTDSNCKVEQGNYLALENRQSIVNASTPVSILNKSPFGMRSPMEKKKTKLKDKINKVKFKDEIDGRSLVEFIDIPLINNRKDEKKDQVSCSCVIF
jgi:hypothetical protein